MSDHDFLDAVIQDTGNSWPVRLSAVIPVQYEIPTDVGIRVDWHLDLGISRTNLDQMEWSELDDLIQGNPSLKFRINGQSLVDVAGWFGETRSRIGDSPPDISLDVDLAWHDLTGPVESVEAVWVVGSSVQSLGHLTVRDAVVEQPEPEPSFDKESNDGQQAGTGCVVWVHMALLILCTFGTAAVGGAVWLFNSMEPLTLFVLVPLVFVCEQVFERFIPARCPRCGSRARCHVLSRKPAMPHTHGAYNRSDVDRVPCYDCVNCDFRFPDPRHHADDWH